MVWCGSRGDPLGPEMFARPGAIVAATVSGVVGPDLEAKPDLAVLPIAEGHMS